MLNTPQQYKCVRGRGSPSLQCNAGARGRGGGVGALPPSSVPAALNPALTQRSGPYLVKVMSWVMGSARSMNMTYTHDTETRRCF